MEESLFNSFMNGPDQNGRFGQFGGRFVSETLMPLILDLETEYERAKTDESFWTEMDHLWTHYVGRPSPLYFAERLTEYLDGAKIYMKRDELNHTGAHKINNSLFQILLAKRMQKSKIYAETGAGAHLIATAAACAKFNLPCIGYMGKDDIFKQSTNVLKAKLFGAKVIECVDGTGEHGVLKDACTAVLKAWSNDPDAFYCCGSAIGPHPFPRIVQYAQSVIGKEIKEQILEKEGRLPDAIVACIGGGSNLIGSVHEFLDDKEVELHGIEPEHSAALTNGTVGIMQGFKSFMLQSESGDATLSTQSLASGINFYSAGPEHAYLKQINRIKYSHVSDKEAFDAFQLICKTEGILIAFEPAFAVAHGIKLAKEMGKDKILVLNICGRGDKDIDTAEKMLGDSLDK